MLMFMLGFYSSGFVLMGMKNAFLFVLGGGKGRDFFPCVLRTVCWPFFFFDFIRPF